MTQPIDYMTPDLTPPEFVRRKTGLLVFGIILIIMGTIAGCLVLAVPFGAYMSRRVGAPGSALPLRQAITGMLVYAVASASLVWLGIGSIRARRWVRPIVLILGVLSLVMGVLTLVAFSTSFTGIQASIQANSPTSGPAPPPAMVWGSLLAGFGCSAILFIVIPAVFIWYYRPIEMQRALEFYDPTQRWTDRCPLPVLGVAVTAALLAVATLMSLVTPVTALFGVIITGVPATAIQLAMIVAFTAVAWWSYKQRMIGWYVAVLLMLLLAIATIVNSVRLDSTELAAAMGMSSQQQAAMQMNPMSHSIALAVTGALIMIMCMVYAVWVRRYFISSAPHAPVG